MIFARPEAVYLFSDGIAYDDEGVVQQIHSKILLAPENSAAIHVTGTGPVLSMIGYQLSHRSPRNFDEIMAQMPDILDWVDETLLTEEHPYPVDYMVALGGWSNEGDRYAARIIHKVPADLEATYGRHKIEPIVSYAKPDPDAQFLLAAGFTCSLEKLGDELDRMHPIEFGARLMMAQRKTKTYLHRKGGPEGYIVGGFCQLAVLTREAAFSQILWRWPDEIGKPVDPANDSPQASLSVTVPEAMWNWIKREAAGEQIG